MKIVFVIQGYTITKSKESKLGVPEGEKKQGELKSLFTEIIAENSNLEKDRDTLKYRSTQNSCTHYQRRSSLWHILVKILIAKRQENILKCA